MGFITVGGGLHLYSYFKHPPTSLFEVWRDFFARKWYFKEIVLWPLLFGIPLRLYKIIDAFCGKRSGNKAYSA